MQYGLVRKRIINTWWKYQDNDKDWIKEQEDMSKYVTAFEGFLNDNAEGQLKNSKAPKYRSSASGKSAIVAKVDIPAGSVITFGAWGGKGQYGPYIKISGQMIQEEQQQTQQPAMHAPDFDDDIPF